MATTGTAIGTTQETALDTLRARWSEADPYDYRLEDLRELQLAAATERLRACRAVIPVLDRRAGEAGVDEVTDPAHLVPLLLSHASYKSYPRAFVTRGKWAGLGRWLDTLSMRSVADVPLDGVADVDDWVARLHAHGHHVMSSSGTTGKPSFVPTGVDDHAAVRDGYLAGLRAMAGAEPDGGLEAFLAVPKGATTVVQLAMIGVAERMGEHTGRAPRYLSNEPMLLSDLNRLGELRHAIVEGTATAGQIADHEAAVAGRGERMSAQLGGFVQDVLAARDRPLLLAATYGLLWGIVRAGRARGLTDGAFHPDTVILTGGGLKGLSAPPDFRDQISAFLGPGVGMLDAYGMSEFNGPFARCAQGRYHLPPTTLLVPLDKTGESLLAPGPDGSVTVRCAALDLAVHDRWGGVISGDRITVEYHPCGCGRGSPALHDVVRYTDLPEGDDKLSCAASVDAYIRGEIRDELA